MQYINSSKIKPEEILISWLNIMANDPGTIYNGKSTSHKLTVGKYIYTVRCSNIL